MQALERLQAAWQAETHLGRKACLQAQKASVQVLWGDEAVARAATAELRQTFAGREFPRLSATLCLVDGLLLDRQGRLDQARDRFHRARQLAEVAEACPVAVLSGAWLAQQYSRLEQWSLCAKTLADVLAAAQPHQSDALWRVALTSANACMRAGWSGMAHTWYRRARAQATRCDDGVAMGQVLHDVAIAQVERLRRVFALSSPATLCAQDLQAAQTLTNAACNYLALSNSPALRALRPRLQWARACLHVWQGEPALALQVLEPLMRAGLPTDVPSRLDLLTQCQVDRWWCATSLSAPVLGQGMGQGMGQRTDEPDPEVLKHLLSPAMPIHLRWVMVETACDAERRSGYDSLAREQPRSELAKARRQAMSDWRLSAQQLRVALNANRLEPDRWEKLYES